MNEETSDVAAATSKSRDIKMKAFIFPSSLLLLAFVPIHASMEEASFQRICREAITGDDTTVDDYNFCVSTLQGIPVDPNASIREMAMTVVERLLNNCSHGIASLNHDGMAPDFNFGSIFKCISSFVEVVKDIKEAITKIQSGDIAGAIEELNSASSAVANCLGDSSSGGGDVPLPANIRWIFKVFRIVIKIVKWLTKIL